MFILISSDHDGLIKTPRAKKSRMAESSSSFSQRVNEELAALPESQQSQCPGGWF